MALIRVKARQKGVTGYINCMRGTMFGNPYSLKHYSRKLSLLNYEEYLRFRAQEKVFRNELQKQKSSLADQANVAFLLSWQPIQLCFTSISKITGKD